ASRRDNSSTSTVACPRPMRPFSVIGLPATNQSFGSIQSSSPGHGLLNSHALGRAVASLIRSLGTFHVGAGFGGPSSPNRIFPFSTPSNQLFGPARSWPCESHHSRSGENSSVASGGIGDSSSPLTPHAP